MTVEEWNTRTPDDAGEHCDECQQAYAHVYTLPDWLWAAIHPRAPAGLLCPSCAVMRAWSLDDAAILEVARRVRDAIYKARFDQDKAEHYAKDAWPDATLLKIARGE